MIDAQGWHARARRVPSPNFDARAPGCAVELLVVHCISLPAGRYGGPHVDALFLNRLDLDADPSFESLRGLRVSAHFFVDRRGRLTQYVSCLDRAWHAGVSRFEDRERCNDFSIGVELEGLHTDRFTARQYRTLAALTRGLQRRFPTLRAVRGHEEIAPGRKLDPGPHFDWQRYLSEAGLDPAVRP
jgi:AmpD protein